MTDFSNNYSTALRGTEAYGDLLLDANSDLVLTSDANSAGTNAIGQDILMRLKTFLGECYTNTSLGVPYFQQLLGQKAPASTWNAVLQAVVLQTPGVIHITSWNASVDGAKRAFTVMFAAQTVAGAVDYNETISLS